MTFEAENVTGSLLTWEATNELRWFVVPRRWFSTLFSNQQLQQKWLNRQTHVEEWRVVPTTTGDN
jgi:hypothetical protein